MSPSIDTLLLAALKQILERHETLSRETTRRLLDAILDEARLQPPSPLLAALSGQEGETRSASLNSRVEIQMAALLAAMAARGETEEELAGFVDSLRAHATLVPLPAGERAQLVDTCGTGGDSSGTFNISTAAGLVAAAAGACVAKHGNRAVTSKSGSADVLEALEIPVDLSPERAAQALRQHRFAFLSAPALQPAMRAVMRVRQVLGVRTAFNLLGPMTNPAGAPAQVIGVYARELVPKVAQTLARLGARRAFVVHGSTHVREGKQPGAERGGLDELSISGPSAVAEVTGDQVRFFTVAPQDFGLAIAPIESLTGGDASANAAILRGIFSGQKGAARDVVVMNASAVLVIAGLAEDFLSGARLAEATIDSGKVLELITALAQGT